MTSQTQPRYRPRLLWAIRRALGDYYDRLGLTVLGSIVLLVPLMIATTLGGVLDRFIPRAIATVLVALLAWYGVSFAWAGNVLQAHRIAAFEDPGIDAYGQLFRRYGTGILKLASIQLVITLVVLLDTAFFLHQRFWVMQIAGVITAYILLLWSMMILWHYPFLIYENGKTLRILKKSALVVMDNAFFTAAALFVTIAGGILLTVSVVGAPLAFGGVLSCFVVRAHRECLKKYEMAEDEPEEPQDAGWPQTKDPPRRLNPRLSPAGMASKQRSDSPTDYPNETEHT